MQKTKSKLRISDYIIRFFFVSSFFFISLTVYGHETNLCCSKNAPLHCENKVDSVNNFIDNELFDKLINKKTKNCDDVTHCKCFNTAFNYDLPKKHNSKVKYIALVILFNDSCIFLPPRNKKNRPFFLKPYLISPFPAPLNKIILLI
ncbi:MAG TPA: hypothetical protein QF753_07835 [Victivallales bacterium]|nr:hypothetical protein [Victivallales bacterium]